MTLLKIYFQIFRERLTNGELKPELDDNNNKWKKYKEHKGKTEQNTLKYFYSPKK